MKAVQLTRFRALVFVVLSLLLAVSLAAAQDGEPVRTPEEESLVEQVYRIVDEGLTPGDYDVVNEILSEDYVIHSPLGDLDREGFIGFIEALRASMPDLALAREAVIVEGSTIATRTLITGTFDGEPFASPFGVLSPNDQTVTVNVHTYFIFDEEGRLVEEWAMFDLLGFFTQLGAFPAN